jgi:hypothetical protein
MHEVIIYGINAENKEFKNPPMSFYPHTSQRTFNTASPNLSYLITFI